jgi:hypothetical protein
MNWLTLLRRKLYYFNQLDNTERKLVGQAFVLLWLVSGGLKLRKLQTIQSWLAYWYPYTTEKNQQAMQQLQIIKDSVRRVQLASRYTPSARCLQRSLILWALLRQQGIEAELKIAAKKNSPTFEAHAWLEYQGHVLNDASNVQQHFAVFNQPTPSSQNTEK